MEKNNDIFCRDQTPLKVIIFLTIVGYSSKIVCFGTEEF